MKFFYNLLCVLLISCASSVFVNAQTQPANYDESKVPEYQLPDPLVFNDGTVVKNARQWTKHRRAEILEIFSQEMYGHMPSRPEGLHFETVSQETVYDGLAIRRIVRIYLDKDEQHWFDALVHLPKDAQKPVPVFMGLNFDGNQNTVPGSLRDSRWCSLQVLKAGYALVTACRNAIEPDGRDSRIASEEIICQDGGVRAWYNKGGDWGAITAWAWALSRMVDYLETDKAFDCSKIAVVGHSRLGKTALWAAANDLRIDLVISNNSGCCGAALSRRVYGENFSIIGTAFPHWFTREFDKYMWNEDKFPADQHWLAALAAPRPLYVASATEDLWADPIGEWLTAYNAGPVYGLFKKKGLSDTMPSAGESDNLNQVGYHLRVGPHDINTFDWTRYIEFADRHFKTK